MAIDLKNILVIAISSRALFDLEHENRIFDNEGVGAYRQFTHANEEQVLEKGTAYALVEALLRLNSKEQQIVEVIILSRNAPDTGLRIFNSIEYYGLDISRAAFSGGASIFEYLEAFNVDLFLSKSEHDVQQAINRGFAAAMLYAPPHQKRENKQIRIAFDADAVIFSQESELIYQEQGLDAFLEHETVMATEAMNEGPFAKLLKTLAMIQNRIDASHTLMRLAIVTARNSPAHKRVVLTLRAWGVEIDEAYFLGGIEKKHILEVFAPQIFFDDQARHLEEASTVVPSGKVPYKK